MSKLMTWGLVAGVSLMGSGLLLGCGVFDDGFIGTVDDMVASGQMTPERGGEIIAAYMEWARVASENSMWNTLLVGAGSVLAAYTGINLFPGKKIKNPA